MRLCGSMARVNKRWIKDDFTGEIEFYTTLGKKHDGWLDWSAYFVKGQLNQIHLIEHTNGKH